MKKIKDIHEIAFFPFKNNLHSILIYKDGEKNKINWDEAPRGCASPKEAIKFGHALIKAGLKAMKL